MGDFLSLFGITAEDLVNLHVPQIFLSVRNQIFCIIQETLIGSASDFWGRGPEFESGISLNDALQDHCAMM